MPLAVSADSESFNFNFKLKPASEFRAYRTT